MYILDYDPIKAARGLIRTHIVRYIKILQCSFVKMHSGFSMLPKYYMKKYMKNLYYSKENYLWFSEFYTELKKLINFNPTYIDRFDESMVYDTDGLVFHHKGLNLPQISTNPENVDLVLYNRMIYIKKNYDKSNFVGGKYPEWYVNISTEVMQKYDRNSGKGLKITVDDNGYYRYWIANYFNKWIEIKDVPKEIKYFINVLLTKD